MNSTLFLQSDVSDPYLFYKNRLENEQAYWDETSKIWAIYSYDACVSILKNPKAEIPQINQNNEQKLNTKALEILNNLTRLSNGTRHEISKEIAILLFSKMKSVDINSIISQLIKNNLIGNKIDWVNSVCKKLPALVILKSFGFGEKDCDFISNQIEFLVKLMLPQKTEEQVNSINEVSPAIFSIVEKQLSSLHFYESLSAKISESNSLSLDEIKTISISNLIGFFVQSFDAGRGLLSNSLLQILNNKTFSDKAEIEKAVIETLRFDPPIHNTRRIAVEDITLGESQIKKGDSILIVLASANRDPEKFENPLNFDIERSNNNENLTFGIGAHMCLAKYFSIHLATEALWFLFDHYKTIELLENNTQYESMINARLPKNIWISIK
ncbi:cytochrome P450 [Flavobacterium daemonense]|uniref:cytochrome P450 n=1 Tax=Flavobacterium daemonense TaxID=1393049 RepID=UPI0011865967|nr:cytochrome P450 [Flavobacterium daemonense]KAF2325786.1 cytochrome P450 [Flavobacterium daemonense]